MMYGAQIAAHRVMLFVGHLMIISFRTDYLTLEAKTQVQNN